MMKNESSKHSKKRALDVFGAISAIAIFSPIMIGIVALIKIVSPGPVLFKQTRVGLNGKRFQCLKFRTMRPNAATTSHTNHFAELIASDQPMTKLDKKGDPRVIPLGSILRASGLDELPQLFNIILGDMSLVGPRPGTVAEYELYTTRDRRRLEALPGLTGLWQVSGKNDTTFSEMIDLDIRYCEEADLGTDLRIIAQTWKVVAKQLAERFAPEPKLTQAKI